MNWLDYLLATVIGASTFSGLWRGFARTIVGTVAAVAAIVLAAWFYGTAGSVVQPYVSHPTISNVLGFLVVFLAVTLAGTVLGWALAKLFKWVGLGWLDRLLGAGLGVVRGMLVSTGIVLLLCAFSRKPPPDSVVESRIAPYVIEVSNVISYIAPRELKDGFKDSYEKAKKIWAGVWSAAPKTL